VQTALAGYTLGINVENLTLTGVANIAGNGNALNTSSLAMLETMC